MERVVYADSLDVQSGEMVRPMIVWFEDGKPAMVAKAERGVWQGGNWQLFNGVNVFLDRERQVSSSFDSLEADFPTAPKEIAQQSRSPNEMTYRELREYIRYALRQDRPTVELELTLHHKSSIPFACLVLALIVLILFHPVLRVPRPQKRDAFLAVLVDDSRSMSIRDAAAGRSRLGAAQSILQREDGQGE